MSLNIPEEELVLSCLRSTIQPREADRISCLAGQNLDWGRVVAISQRHAVSPLLYKNLRTIGQHAVPASIMKQLQEQFYWNLAHNMRLERELSELLGALEQQGIPAIPFKGPALAVSIYGNLALRVFGDLDIFVQKKDVQRALASMASMGYRPEAMLDSCQMDGYLDTFYEMTLTGAGKAPVELHWEIYADNFAFPVGRLQIWDDKQSVPRESIPRSISPDKLLLILCVHGTQHYWERLSWICDVAEMVRRSEDIHWERLLELSVETGARRMLLLGLSLAHDLLDAPLPDHVVRAIRKDGRIDRAVTEIRRRLFEATDHAPGVLQTCLFYITIRERMRDKARVLFRTLSRPVPGELDRLGSDGCAARLGNVIRHVMIGCGYGLDVARQRLKRQVNPTAG